MAGADPTVPAVWARTSPRREQPALSRERIVAEAVCLLDQQGPEALSMRMLGRRLEVGATSMYRHVANKDELVELVADEVYTEVEVPDADGPGRWRSSVAAAARSLRAMVLRHPWVTARLGRARSGPNLARASERMLDVLESGGFDRAEGRDAVSAVVAYVVGTVTSEAVWPPATVEDAAPVGEKTFEYGLERLLDGLAARPGADV